MKSIRTNEMAKLLGVTPQTIRKYAENNQIAYHLTPKQQLLFTPEDIQTNLGETSSTPKPTYAIHYVRSSSGNKQGLANQAQMLETRYGAPDKLIKDSASGLNENRKGLNTLLDLVMSGNVTHVRVTRKDRLARFGGKYLQRILDEHGVILECMDEALNPSLQEELVDDLMSILASFSGRYSRLKTKQAQAALLKKMSERL